MTRRASKFLIHLLGTLVGVVTVLLALMAWRLAQGPIEMGSVTPFVEAAINDQELGFTIQADQAELTWGDWQEAFEIRVLGFQAFDETGIRLLSAHEVVLEMALPPLVRGELRPKSVTLVRPQLSATRQPDGSMGFALIDTFTDSEGADAVDEGGPPPQLLDETAFGGRDLLEGFLALAEQAPFDRLVDVEVVGADLWVDDRMLGLMWNAAAAVTLRRVDEGVELDAQLVLKTEGHTLDADVVATYNATDGETMLSSHLAAFSLAGLSDLIPQLPDLEGLDVVVDGQVEARFDGQSGVVSGSFLVDAQSGTINLPGVFEGPFEIGPSHVRGYIRPGFSGLELTDVALDLGIEKVHGRVVIGGFDLESEIEARVDLTGVAVNDLSRYWPARLAVSARTWVLRSISDGTIDQASIAFRAGIDQLFEGRLPLSNLVIDLDVSDATVQYLPTMPAILGVGGRVAIIDNTLRIDAGGGRVEGLSLSRGIVTMDSLDGQEGMLIGVELSGNIQDALVMANHEPFVLAGRVGIDPSLIDGAFAGRLEIVLPRLADLTADQVLYRVAAEAQGVALTTELRGGYRLDSGNGLLLLDSTQALLEGDVRLNGVLFQARYHHDLTPEAEIIRVVSLEGRVDDKDRAALGLADPIDISGPVDIVLDMAQTSDETMIWNVVADLAPVTALFPLIGIDKAAGEPGRAAVRLVDDGGAVLFVEQVDLGVGATVVKGSGVLRATDLSLARLDLARFAFGRNDFSGAVSVREDGFFDVTLAGGEVDLEPMMDQITALSSPELPPFQIRGRLDRIWITDNDAVGDVHVEGVHLADDWESLAITGVIADGSPMSVNIWRFSETERRFEYNADNAGDAIRTFGLFDNADGGALQMRARIDDSDPERPVNGVIRLDGFVLKEAPILAQIASLASLTAIGNALTGNGLEFDGALMPFRKVGDIVTFQDARVFGPGLGLTIAGDIDLGANLLDLNGTIVPAHLINAAVGEIPIIGDLLTGEEEGGGIFAFTFDVDGPRESPEIEVDPLSVLAPGILRNMFTAPTDEEVEQLVQGANKPEGGR